MAYVNIKITSQWINLSEFLGHCQTLYCSTVHCQQESSCWLALMAVQNVISYLGGAMKYLGLVTSGHSSNSSQRARKKPAQDVFTLHLRDGGNGGYVSE